jgi:hypothetical protein
MGDLIFNGGKYVSGIGQVLPIFLLKISHFIRYGVWIGNQQFTVRNITVNNAQTAIYSQWNWG